MNSYLSSLPLSSLVGQLSRDCIHEHDGAQNVVLAEQPVDVKSASEQGKA